MPPPGVKLLAAHRHRSGHSRKPFLTPVRSISANKASWMTSTLKVHRSKTGRISVAPADWRRVGFIFLDTNSDRSYSGSASTKSSCSTISPNT